MSFLNILFLLLCKMKNFNFITVISGLEFRRIFLEAWNVTWDSGENSLWSSWLLQSRSVAIPGPDDMTEQAWRLADAYMGLVSASRSTGWRIFRPYPKQLNLNQFLETGPQASECTDSLRYAKVQSGWRPLCKRWVKARISRMLVVMISQIHCFFSLFLDLSQFYFRNPPVLKINCLFSFSLQAHSFLHIVSLKCFSLLACFYFHVFVSMNEMWGNWVRNVSSTLTWRRNSIHCRSSSF